MNVDYHQAIKYLIERKLIQDCTDLESLQKQLENGITLYAGFDLTGPSLHVGHMALLMVLRTFIRYGSRVIILLGGGTTKIGDPSGKDTMRTILTTEQISLNKLSIVQNIMNIISLDYIKEVCISRDNEVLWQSENKNIIVIDNDYWLGNLRYIDFLRDIGRYFSVNRMLTMDSVKLRLERQQPLSFIEFNYMIMQGYDFWHLYKQYDCSVQVGGSDQWGNIVQGIDLINKKEQSHLTKTPIGLTVPLVTTSSGTKMGKTESGAIWLTRGMTTPYDYFQYFRNTDDADVKKFLLIFTDLEIDEIDVMISDNINEAKSKLAFEATKICHGFDAANNAIESSNKIFIQKEIDPDNIIEIHRSEGVGIIDLMIDAGLASSKSEARRLIEANGVKINHKMIANVNLVVDIQYLAEVSKSMSDNYINFASKGIFLLSSGKKKHVTILLKNE